MNIQAPSLRGAQSATRQSSKNWIASLFAMLTPRNDGALICLCALLACTAFSSAHAEYQSPFHCMPPMGQQMFEIAAMNMTRAYRQDPTAASKAKACTSSKKVVKVYQDAVKACNSDDCTEAQFIETCARKAAKLQEWKENTQIVCNSKIPAKEL